MILKSYLSSIIATDKQLPLAFDEEKLQFPSVNGG